MRKVTRSSEMLTQRMPCGSAIFEAKEVDKNIQDKNITNLPPVAPASSITCQLFLVKISCPCHFLSGSAIFDEKEADNNAFLFNNPACSPNSD